MSLPGMIHAQVSNFRIEKAVVKIRKADAYKRFIFIFRGRLVSVTVSKDILTNEMDQKTHLSSILLSVYVPVLYAKGKMVKLFLILTKHHAMKT
jgi:hypothetical protein